MAQQVVCHDGVENKSWCLSEAVKSEAFLQLSGHELGSLLTCGASGGSACSLAVGDSQLEPCVKLQCSQRSRWEGFPGHPELLVPFCSGWFSLSRGTETGPQQCSSSWDS